MIYLILVILGVFFVLGLICVFFVLFVWFLDIPITREELINELKRLKE